MTRTDKLSKITKVFESIVAKVITLPNNLFGAVLDQYKLSHDILLEGKMLQVNEMAHDEGISRTLHEYYKLILIIILFTVQIQSRILTKLKLSNEDF